MSILKELSSILTAPFRYATEEWRKADERDGYRQLSLQFPAPQPNSHDQAYYSGSLNTIIEEGLDFGETTKDIRQDFYSIYSTLNTKTLEHAKNIAGKGATLFKNNENLLRNRHETVAAEFFINICRELAITHMRADIYRAKSEEIFQAGRDKMDSLLTEAENRLEQIGKKYKPIDTEIATAKLMIEFAKESNLPILQATVQRVEQAETKRQEKLEQQGSGDNHPGPSSAKIASEKRTGRSKGIVGDVNS